MAPPALPLPPRPDLVFRVAFAGNINLPFDAASQRAKALDEVLDALAQQLAALPTPPPSAIDAQQLTDYYASAAPLLRLVTGLAEGSDNEAAAARVRLEKRQSEAELPARPVRTELAAVLGCDVASYRESRSEAYRPAFDELVQQCAYVLTLDGRYQPGDAGEASRRQMYRAQSTLLLRQADLLLAVADPQQAGKAGGTLETVQQALRFGLPVVFVHAGTGHVHYLAPGEDPTPLLETLAEADPDSTAWREPLVEWVRATIDSPKVHDAESSQPEPLSKKEHHVLQEYFVRTDVPRYQQAAVAGKLLRRPTRLERYWNWIVAWFAPASVPPSSFSETRWRRFKAWLRGRPANGPLVPFVRYEQYRRRAADLSAHYAGRYRGTFASNYTLATVVALFVGIALTLLDHRATHYGTEYALTDFLLESGKVLCIGFVFYYTRRAQTERWNDCAVDYRHLAERLKTMNTLSALGSFQPPAAASLHFASRVVRQSAVEWLFKAIVRSVPPRDPDLAPVEVPVAGRKEPLLVRELPCHAETGLKVLAEWIGSETSYHLRNEATMKRMHNWLERSAQLIGVVFLVVLGLNYLGLFSAVDWTEMWQHLKEWFHHSEPHSTGPVLKPYDAFEHYVPNHTGRNWIQRLYLPVAPPLLFFTVLLPVIVVALSGIRLQSESRRLAERSDFLLKLLKQRQLRVAQLTAECLNNPTGSWNISALKEGEGVAADHVQEVTEWIVVYAKDIPDS